MGIEAKLTLKDFQDLEAIDHAVGFSSITPADVCFEQYKRFPQFICVIRDGEKVIGYINTLALKPEIFHKFREAEIEENDITLDDIDYETQPVHLLFQSIAIHPKHQNMRNAKRLFEIFFQHTKQMVENGMQVAEFIAECSTNKGVAMATRYWKMKPYKKTKYGQIYTLDGKSFMEKLR